MSVEDFSSGDSTRFQTRLANQTKNNLVSESISPNTTIAQYAILSKIGEGGTGVVWRTRDMKLGRDVQQSSARILFRECRSA